MGKKADVRDQFADENGIDRRTFLGAAIAGALPFVFPGDVTTVRETTATAAPIGPEPVPVELVVNGVRRRLEIEPRVTLLDALREHLGLTGTKKGCDHGQCGACTVHIEGQRVLACMTLVLQARGKHVTTIEGLASGETLHPMQRAFLDHDGFQCGYCTPGQIMSAVALVNEPCGESDAAVRECMSGNICRCGAYPNIVAAIQSVRAARRG